MSDKTTARLMRLADDYAKSWGNELRQMVARTETDAARAALEAEVRRVMTVVGIAQADWIIGEPMTDELAKAVKAWIDGGAA